MVMAWYGVRGDSPAPDEADRFRMQQGQELGALARELYPGGILVSKADGKSPAEITKEIIADGTKQALFEATVVAGPFVAKADILQRQNGAWHLLEVKSRFSDTGNIQELVDDLAYTTMVCERAGLPVAKASLALLSRRYRFGDDVDHLFEILHKTGDVLARVAKFEGVADLYAKALFHGTRPTPLLGSACRDCPFFHDKCLSARLAHTVLELPGLHHKKLMRLSAEGIIDLSCVPDDLNLNARQERAKSSALSGKPFVDAGLGKALSEIVWPCHYLDFETVATVLPLYNGHGCHQQVLTQFSVHHRDSVDAAAHHSEYLADAAKDCQKELAEALIRALGQNGSVIVYSGFEKTRIKALQDDFPELAAPLETILGRLVDLRSLIADYVYHPEFQGSFSIKKVLPALVPELSYKDLAVGDGDTAMTRFARMARREIVGNMTETTRRRLLDYCKLDTLAMVRLHETLIKMASAR
jgi:hypothetical protein